MLDEKLENVTFCNLLSFKIYLSFPYFLSKKKNTQAGSPHSSRCSTATKFWKCIFVNEIKFVSLLKSSAEINFIIFSSLFDRCS